MTFYNNQVIALHDHKLCSLLGNQNICEFYAEFAINLLDSGKHKNELMSMIRSFSEYQVKASGDLSLKVLK